MESKNSTSGSSEELMEPLIGKEENSKRPQVRSSRGHRTDYVPHPVAHPKDSKQLFKMESKDSTFGSTEVLMEPENKSSLGSSTDYVPHLYVHPKDTNAFTGSVEIPKELKIDVHENLEPHRLCCIYRVPRALRKMNEEAYTPKVISIGPLHHGKDEFADMEKQKKRLLREFGKRIRPEKWQQLINFVEGNEQDIRNSYEENFKLEQDIRNSYEENFKLGKFIILYDAVFIIELFLRYHREESDFLLERSCLRQTVLSDLRLLENQLPFYVLDGLHKLALPDLGPENGYHSFISLSCVFFGHCKRGEKPVWVKYRTGPLKIFQLEQDTPRTAWPERPFWSKLVKVEEIQTCSSPSTPSPARGQGREPSTSLLLADFHEHSWARPDPRQPDPFSQNPGTPFDV